MKALDELRAIAEAADADGRPWEWGGDYPQRVLRIGDVAIVAEVFESPDHPSRFAEFIATFDPPTVLALIEQAGMAEAPADKLADRIRLVMGSNASWDPIDIGLGEAALAELLARVADLERETNK